MIKYLLILVSISYLNASTSLKSHEHGVVNLEMGIDENLIEISLDGPLESFLGFEHAIKSKEDQIAFEKAKNIWEKKFFELLKISSSIKCEIQKSEFRIENEKEGHADLRGTKEIKCDKKLRGQKVIINFKNYYKHMQKIKLELISDKPQIFLITEKNKTVEI